ncbi:hypothetical protein ACO0LO_03640 [Undibacterium sp. TJN25]|uniref:hypothetical protein n=1 Tax=Undibacterium sp. TJN25 TaxID=3413056 RepID=UPI003BF2E8EF
MNPSILAALRRQALACCALLATSALPPFAMAQTVQPAQPEKRPDPLEARAPVPALQYQSSLQTYRPFADEEVGNWRAQNDAVGKIGGWRTYARQAREPDAAELNAGGKKSPAAMKEEGGQQGHSHQHAEHGQ